MTGSIPPLARTLTESSILVRKAEGDKTVISHRTFFQKGSELAAVILLSALTLSMAAIPLATQATETSEKPLAAANCDVLLDISGSVLGLRDIWEHVREELPSIVETYHCERLMVYSFDVEGWAPKRLKGIELPLWRPLKRAKCPTEICVFKNMQQRFNEEDRLEEEQARQRHQEDVLNALKALDEVTRVIPAPSHDSKGSDIVGLFAKYAEIRDPRGRIALVVSDLADTNYKQKTLPVIPWPSGNVRVLVLLAPATQKDAKLVWGKELRAWKQYQLQRRALERLAPWAIGVPFDTKGLAERFPLVKKTMIAEKSEINHHPEHRR